MLCFGSQPTINGDGRFFRRIWGKLGIDKIGVVGKGIFIIPFDTTEACLKVAMEGFQLFDQKPLITKLWDPDMMWIKLI